MAMRIEPKNATVPRVPLYPYSFPNEMVAAAVSSAAIAATIKQMTDVILMSSMIPIDSRSTAHSQAYWVE
jgi:hypothetical protein